DALGQLAGCCNRAELICYREYVLCLRPVNCCHAVGKRRPAFRYVEARWTPNLRGFLSRVESRKHQFLCPWREIRGRLGVENDALAAANPKSVRSRCTGIEAILAYCEATDERRPCVLLIALQVQLDHAVRREAPRTGLIFDDFLKQNEDH